MSLHTAVELAVLALALGAGWLSLRRPEALDWERLWKTILATVIRGDVERLGGDQAQWWERLRTVPFHPAGRDAAAKLNRADLGEIPVPSLEGERLLVERLAGIETVQKRWEAMYREDAAAKASLLGNPDELGPSYDPSACLAPGIGWSNVAVWDAHIQAAIARRLTGTVVVVFGTRGPALTEALPLGTVVMLDQADEAAVMACVPESHQRVVLIAEGDRVHRMMQLLHSSPVLRDRVLAVFAIDAAFEEQWMQQHFHHEPFDTELNRRTPYLAITNGSSGDAAIKEQRFPIPPDHPSGWSPIESIDLGVVPLDQHDPELLARALWVLVSFCLSRT